MERRQMNPTTMKNLQKPNQDIVHLIVRSMTMMNPLMMATYPIRRTR